MAVTLKDIARDLGVSVITVSKALRAHSDISAETKSRVLKRVKEMNYRPNLSARALVTGRTNLLGFVVPELLHSFFSEIVRGVSSALDGTGYTLVTSSAEQDPKRERQAVERLVARRGGRAAGGFNAVDGRDVPARRGGRHSLGPDRPELRRAGRPFRRGWG